MTSGVESFQAILLAFCFALRILYLYAMMAIKYLKLQNLLFHTMEKQTSRGQSNIYLTVWRISGEKASQYIDGVSTSSNEQ